MQARPIAWLLKATKPRLAAAAGKSAAGKGWTVPKTPVEILAESLRRDPDWQIAPNRVHRLGISIGWRRPINSAHPGIALQVDGKARPLSGAEAGLLAKSVRALLATAANGDPDSSGG